MPVNATVETNFLYRFEAASVVHTFTNIDREQPYNGETYKADWPVDHANAPTFGSEAQEAEMDIAFAEGCLLSDLFINGPPPFPVTLRIYDYDRVTGVATPYYRGWVVRCSFSLTSSTVSFHCKSVWHFFERETFTSSLGALSRYLVFDPRADVDLESFRVPVTVDTLNDERDVLTVTGITQPDDWFKGGVIVAPNQDKRTILSHKTVGLTKQLTLSAAFPLFTLAAGFTADLYPGDDLTYATWANKFGSVTDNGEKWGGWQYTPNVDPSVKGVI